MNDKIPNCAICKWEKYDHIALILDNCKKCSAQGGSYAIDVYNNCICKIIFEKKEK